MSGHLRLVLVAISPRLNEDGCSKCADGYIVAVAIVTVI